MQDKATTRCAQPLDWRVGLLAFCTTVLIGSVCTIWALQQLHHSTQQQASQAAQALAHSVAHTLSQQIARAIRIGIPANHIPGLDSYLQRALDQAPGLAYIALRSPNNTTLNTTQLRPAHEEIHAEVQVHGQTVGIVAVGTAPATLTHGLTAIQALSALLVLCMGLLSGWLAARGPGKRLEQQRCQLEMGLQGARLTPAVPLHHTSNALEQALEALAQGQQQQQEQATMLNSYAEELLAVDFDHRMQVRIAQIMAPTSTSTPSGSQDGEA